MGDAIRTHGKLSGGNLVMPPCPYPVKRVSTEDVLDPATDETVQVETESVEYVIHPTAEELEADGWLQIAGTRDKQPGKAVVGRHYEEIDGKIWHVFDYADEIEAPRVYSKLYLELGLSAVGALDTVFAILREIQIANGYTAMMAYERANELSTGFDGWATLYKDVTDRVKSEIPTITDAMIATILAAAEVK